MNPFKEKSSDLYVLNTKIDMANSCINETMKQVAPISQKQCEKFVKDMALLRRLLR